eukprot:c25273_g2_i2 orf=3-185(-)
MWIKKPSRKNFALRRCQWWGLTQLWRHSGAAKGANRESKEVRENRADDWRTLFPHYLIFIA